MIEACWPLKPVCHWAEIVADSKLCNLTEFWDQQDMPQFKWPTFENQTIFMCMYWPCTLFCSPPPPKFAFKTFKILLLLLSVWFLNLGHSPWMFYVIRRCQNSAVQLCRWLENVLHLSFYVSNIQETRLCNEAKETTSGDSLINGVCQHVHHSSSSARSFRSADSDQSDGAANWKRWI